MTEAIEKALATAMAKSKAHAEYLRATSKLHELKEEESQTRAKVDQLQRRVHAMTADQALGIESEARQMLSGAPIADTSAAAATLEEIKKLRHHLQVLASAIEIQQGIVNSANTKRSSEITGSLRKLHEGIVARCAAALTDAAAAFEEEQAFRDVLVSEGLRFCGNIRPLAYMGRGVGIDKHSDVQVWLKEARDHGYKV